MNGQFNTNNITYLEQILNEILKTAEYLKKNDINEAYLEEASKKIISLYSRRILQKISLEDIRKTNEKDICSIIEREKTRKMISNVIPYRIPLKYVKKV